MSILNSIFIDRQTPVKAEIYSFHNPLYIFQ